MSRILLVQMGTTEPAIVASDGDYDAWFEAILPPCDVVRPFAGDALPDPSGHRGICITGSPLSVRDELPWMLAVGHWALASDKPVLGVCFGHQVIGEALGGRVGKNPGGREVGTVDVALTAAGRADPLFEGLPDVVVVQQTHGDAVVDEPAGIVRLATNPTCPLQAYAVGNRIRCVQFHPEARADVLGRLLDVRGQTAPRLEPSDHGERILGNWVKNWL